MQRTEHLMSRTKPGELCWADLAASDLKTQSEFYEQLFGWTHVDMPTGTDIPYRMFYLGEAVVAGGMQMTPAVYPTGTPSMWNSYFRARSLEDVLERTQQLGGQVVMPAMDVMRSGRMAGIQEPSGGVTMFWQPVEHEGAQLFGVPGSIAWSDFMSRDPEKASAFFGGLLGWEFEPRQTSPLPYWVASVGGRPEAGVMAMPEGIGSEVPPNWMIYFAARDVSETARRIVGLGGTLDAEPMEAGGMSFAVASDPEGATFGIMTAMAE